jgi:hypothetical protein
MRLGVWLRGGAILGLRRRLRLRLRRGTVLRLGLRLHRTVLRLFGSVLLLLRLFGTVLLLLRLLVAVLLLMRLFGAVLWPLLWLIRA